MLQGNKDDQTAIKSPKVGDEAWSFRDVDANSSILVLPEKPLSSTAPRHYVTFGGSGDDALSGNSGADILQSLSIVNENQISEDVTRNQISTPHSSRHTDVYA